MIPGVETEEEWSRQLAGFRDSLAPATPLEEHLVETIARAAWRLSRLQLYENEMLAYAQLNAEQEAATRILFPYGGALSLQGTTAATLIADRIGRLRRLVDLVLGLQTGERDRAGLARDEIELLHDGLYLALSRRGPAADDVHRQVVEALADDPAVTGSGDLAANVLALLRDTDALLGDNDAAGATIGTPAAESALGRLVARYPAELVLIYARPEIMRLDNEARNLDATVEHIRGESLLLDDTRLATVMRNEAHLRRTFFQCLHELQAQQDRRSGLPSPLARLDVQFQS